MTGLIAASVALRPAVRSSKHGHTEKHVLPARHSPCHDVLDAGFLEASQTPETEMPEAANHAAIAVLNGPASEPKPRPLPDETSAVGPACSVLRRHATAIMDAK